MSSDRKVEGKVCCDSLEQCFMKHVIEAEYDLHAKCLRSLLEHKDDVNHDRYTHMQLLLDYGEIILDVASAESKQCISRLLECKAKVNQADVYGETPIFHASRKGHLNTAKLLLDHKANIHQPNKYADTPFFIALSEGRLFIAKLLLDHKAEVNQPTKYGETPLCIALCHDHPRVARLLLKHKANVNQVGSYGQTPLHVATQKRNADIIRVLVEHKANINQFDEEGETPLFVSSTRGYASIARLLLECKANVDHVDHVNIHGYTPYDMAVENRKYDTANVLFNRRVKPVLLHYLYDDVSNMVLSYAEI
jgi:ankyrin repeat protein